LTDMKCPYSLVAQTHITKACGRMVNFVVPSGLNLKNIYE